MSSAGFVFSQNEPVNYERIINWVGSKFGITLSKAMLSRQLKVLGLSVQLVGKHGTESKRVRVYVTVLGGNRNNLRDFGFFDFDGLKIICLDFVTNSYRLDRQTTVSIIGEKQKKFKKQTQCTRTVI